MSRYEFDALVRRVKSEFHEMPGLRVSREQARRLWGLEPAVCEGVIEALLRSDFLKHTSAGLLIRARS